MTSTDPSKEIARLQQAIRKVADAARLESDAMRAAVAECKDGAMKTLFDTHLAELDAVQALIASLDLFERRLPAMLHLNRPKDDRGSPPQTA